MNRVCTSWRFWGLGNSVGYGFGFEVVGGSFCWWLGWVKVLRCNLDDPLCSKDRHLRRFFNRLFPSVLVKNKTFWQKRHHPAARRLNICLRRHESLSSKHSVYMLNEYEAQKCPKIPDFTS